VVQVSEMELYPYVAMITYQVSEMELYPYVAMITYLLCLLRYLGLNLTG